MLKIKKRLVALFLVVCMIGFCFTTVKADSIISEGDFEYKITQGVATVVKYFQGETTAVTVPSKVGGYNVVAIGNGAFKGADVTEVTISEGVTRIEEMAFYTCINLEKIKFPSTMQRIESSAFANCFELNNISLPKSVNFIDVMAFANCPKLGNFTVDANNTVYSTINNVLYNKDKTELLFYPNYKERKSFTLPNSVLIIGERAFYGCHYLEAITLADSVIKIKDEAFKGCSNLNSITVGEKLEKVGENAFKDAKIKKLRVYSLKSKEKIALLFPNVTEIICLCKANHSYDNDKDATCNDCEYKREIVTPSKVPQDITSSTYKISGGYISKIALGTTVSGLISKINEKNYVYVYDKDKKLSKSAIVGTGMTLKLMDGKKVIKSVKIIVSGDTNGDGKATITDMLAVKSHLLKKSTLSTTAKKGADTSGDGALSITDFIQIKAYILKKGKIQPR